ncbi:MAG TPA: TRAP transporter small permease subunit [Thioalkalivibrio sp.]|nr:TRAP transporter small permease subunit [Thioalkalivibrio sp.]
MQGLDRLAGWLHRIEDAVLASLLASMILLAALQIVLRNLFDSGLVWIDPLLKIMVLWLGLLGALAATREDRHITVDLLSRTLPPLLYRMAYTGTRLFAAAICGLIAWHSGRFVAMEFDTGITAFDGLPLWLAESIMPLSFALIAVRFALHALRGAPPRADGDHT